MEAQMRPIPSRCWHDLRFGPNVDRINSATNVQMVGVCLQKEQESFKSSKQGTGRLVVYKMGCCWLTSWVEWLRGEKGVGRGEASMGGVDTGFPVLQG